MFNVNDRVKVVASAELSGECCVKHLIGKVGTITKTGSGVSVDTMLSVKLDGPKGIEDAFWPEELEKIG
ncbi:hypothetical protein LCGC14_0475570 [marine sediment metagenome]|uniref:KOW domain-containing protein n=1 Tax=marine sediment metagenome TaxID=412755 RepID=A0A0F9SG94_9ZZZZ